MVTKAITMEPRAAITPINISQAVQLPDRAVQSGRLFLFRSLMIVDTVKDFNLLLKLAFSR